MDHLKKYLKHFKSINIAVIGDVMLDKYLFGKVDRISPEAPVQIVEVERERYVPGGAANAACNISTMTGNAFLYGIVGNDIAKQIFLDVTRSMSINTSGIVTDAKKPTIQKIRVLAQNQQLLRIDHEDKGYADTELNEKIIRILNENNDMHAVIVSDYAKGTVTKSLLESLKEFTKKKGIRLIIDPKPKHKLLYRDAFIITPNKKEAEEISGIKIETDDDLERAGNRIIEELNCNVLITMGEKGMALFEKNRRHIKIPTVAKEVYDVSGAGDTVIATLGLALSSGASLSEAAVLANHTAGIKVGKVGTAPVSLEELEESLDSHE